MLYLHSLHNSCLKYMKEKALYIDPEVVKSAVKQSFPEPVDGSVPDLVALTQWYRDDEYLHGQGPDAKEAEFLDIPETCHNNRPVFLKPGPNRGAGYSARHQ